MGGRAFKLIFSALVLIGACYGLIRLRIVANGFHNAFSLRYWRERAAGFDLYRPGDHFLKRGRRDRPDLLLTFDDGPHLGSCERILDALKHEGVHADFFVVGKRVKQHPELVRRMIADGNEVGNHTQDHLRLDTLTPKQIDAEIRNCETNVQRACGRTMTLLRPPGMHMSDTVHAEITALGYTVVGWNVGAKDFIPDMQVSDLSAEEAANLKTTTPDLIVQRVLKQAKNGAIILLHDNPVTASAVPRIIEGLKARGYQFRTASEFLAALPNPVAVVANPPKELTATRLTSTSSAIATIH